jgi:hypothetical protein
MSAPRIPRHRPVVIRVGRVRWYESQVYRLLCIVLLAVFGGVGVNALLALWSTTP